MKKTAGSCSWLCMAMASGAFGAEHECSQRMAVRGGEGSGAGGDGSCADWEVWKAFTTSEGLSTWLTPNAVVDLREGGEWTAQFPGGSTGGGTILSFVPEKELVIVGAGSGQVSDGSGDADEGASFHLRRRATRRWCG